MKKKIDKPFLTFTLKRRTKTNHLFLSHFISFVFTERKHIILRRTFAIFYFKKKEKKVEITYKYILTHTEFQMALVFLP